MNEYLLGIGTGLATSAVTWIGLRIWPHIINIVAKESSISGEWKWFDCTSSGAVGTVNIKQLGGHVYGAFNRSTSTDGQATSRTFKFSGSVYGHTVLLQYYEPEDPKNVRGSIVLRVVSGRAVLFGNTMYFDSFKGKISTIRFLLSKKEALSEAEFAHLKQRDCHLALASR